MDPGIQHPETPRRQGGDAGPTCTVCDGDAGADPAESGLNCARCGQWHVLCARCTPNVSEYSRDSAWTCPSCRARPLNS